MEGYNATVLAYGQTGSGKTYTMGTAYTGSGDVCPMGVVPRVVEDAFDAIAEKATGTQCVLSMTYLEIYNEQVRDLLREGSGAEPRHMFYKDEFGNYEVKGLTELPLGSMEDLCCALTEGARRRTTASTQMNAVSSRSHAVITLKLVQRPTQVQLQEAEAVASAPTTPCKATACEDATCDDIEEDSVIKTSLFRLVDLAGSERAKKTGAEGDRLREANNINQSLTTLGLCITALAGKARHVPFRNSKLTQLLTNSLGGNSSTCMLACVSPADSNYEETMLTLRYADAASSIENKPVVNADPIGATNVHLRNMIQVLKTELSRLYAEGASVSSAVLQRFQLGGAVAPFGSPTPARSAGPRAPISVPPPLFPGMRDSRPITGTGAGMAYAAAASHADESDELRTLKVRVRELEADLQVAGAELATTQSALATQSRQGEEMYALASALTTQHVAALTAADKWRWRFDKVTATLDAPLPGTSDEADGQAAAAVQTEEKAAAVEAAAFASADAGTDLTADEAQPPAKLPVIDQEVALTSARAGDQPRASFASDLPVMRLFAEKNTAIALLQAQLVRALTAQAPGGRMSGSGVASLMLGANAGVEGLHGEQAADEEGEAIDSADGDEEAVDAAAAAALAAASAPGDEEVHAMAQHLHMAGELASLHDAIAAKERLFKATEQSVGVQLTEYETLRAQFKSELSKQEEEVLVLQTKLQLLSAELEEAKSSGGSGDSATAGAHSSAKDGQIKALRGKIAQLEKNISNGKRDAARRDREAARLLALKDSIDNSKRERIELEKRMREASKAHAAERRVRSREAAQMAKVRRTDQLRIAKQAAQLQKQAQMIEAGRHKERLARSKEAELLRKQAAAARMRAACTPLNQAIGVEGVVAVTASSSSAAAIRRRPVTGRRTVSSGAGRGRSEVAGADLGQMGGRRRGGGGQDSLGDLLGDTSALDAATTALLQDAVAKVAEQANGSAGGADEAVGCEPVVPGTPSTLSALRTSRTLPEDAQELVAKVLAFRCRKAAWKALREEAAGERTALAQRVTAALQGGAQEEDVDQLKRRVVALTHRMSHANEQWSVVSSQEEAQRLAANQWMSAVAASAAKGGRKGHANLAGRLINWLLSMLIHAQLALHQHEVSSGGAAAGVGQAAAATAAAATRQLETEHAMALHDAYDQVSTLRRELATAKAGVMDSVAAEIAEMLTDAGVNVEGAGSENKASELAAAAGLKISKLRSKLKDTEIIMAQYQQEAQERTDIMVQLQQRLAEGEGCGAAGKASFLRGVQDTSADDDGEEHSLEEVSSNHGISDADLRLGLALAEDVAADSEEGGGDGEEGGGESEEDEFTADASDVLGVGAAVVKGRKTGARRSVYEPTVASAARAQHKCVKASAAHVVGFGGTVFDGQQDAPEDGPTEEGAAGPAEGARRATRSVYSKGDALSGLRKRANYGRRRSMGAELPLSSDSLAAVAEMAAASASAASSPANSPARTARSTTLQALIPNKVPPLADRSNSAGRGVKRTRGSAASAVPATAVTPPKRARAGTAQ
jgi:kinesin family protein 4/21/27